MILDLIWVLGVALSAVALLSGLCLVVAETGPLLRLFGMKSAAPLHITEKDLRLVERLQGAGPDGYSLSGHAVMDAQHQRLFDQANDLRAAILSGRTVAEVDATIDALICDVLEHFRDEEAILAEVGYSGTAKHAALHRELVNSGATLVERFRAGALGIGVLFKFLRHDVMAKHMLGADREFIPCLEGRH